MNAVEAEVTAREQSPDLGKLFAALVKVQQRLEAAKKDKDNPFFKSKYADLAGVWEVCRQPLADNDLCVVQQPVSVPDHIGVRTVLGHSSGQWMAATVLAKPAKSGPQEAGSCITYLRRYALAAVVGVVQEDDDGNVAQGNGAKPPPAKRADKVPAQPSAKLATAEQVKLIHTLKTKTGMDDYLYRRGLAAYKDVAGKPVLTSKDLTEEQASNLIQRLQNLDGRKQSALAGMQAAEGDNLKAAIDRPANGHDVLASQIKAKGLADTDVREYVLAPFGADSVDELEEEDKPKALALVLAYTQGYEPYCAAMRKLGFSTEHLL